MYFKNFLSISHWPTFQVVSHWRLRSKIYKAIWSELPNTRLSSLNRNLPHKLMKGIVQNTDLEGGCNSRKSHTTTDKKKEMQNESGQVL